MKITIRITAFWVLGIVLTVLVLGMWHCIDGEKPIAAQTKKEGIKMILNNKNNRTDSKPGQNGKNRLAGEKSPYLLQHADNPVDWYPWGDEAFEKARLENKPVFLSIGYSTCHWCHVMAHESFEDEEIASLMNDAFINVKVDREERPDIDNIYMTACQMITGSGGWPLTIIMTPDKKPFFAGTYFPRESRFGRTGMMDLVPKIKNLWVTRHEDILNTANHIVSALQNTSQQLTHSELDRDLLQKAAILLSRRFDHEHGGFGNAPKFPAPHNLLFLLRYWQRTGDAPSLNMVEKTLLEMRNGGVYDHLGYGFHRYSTDDKWLVPHFEKMIYDQAMLAIAYAETFQATGNEEYMKTAEEILKYVQRDMTSPEGGFYSAEDADSEGVEGKFYVWSTDEINQILSGNEAKIAGRIFNINESGNFTEQPDGHYTGTNILHLTTPLHALASILSIPEKDLNINFQEIREKLFDVREKRVHPHKDDKILTDWNGLMIAAYSICSRVFHNPHYADTAKHAADFILRTMRDNNGRLFHRYRSGNAGIHGYLDDYAFLIWGLLEIYQSTFELSYLENALKLNQIMIDHFWDHQNGGFYFSPDDGEELITRSKELYDGAIPSGNSVAFLNLLKLGSITGDPQYEKLAHELMQTFAAQVSQMPVGYTQFLSGIAFAAGPSYEIVIAGLPDHEDTKSIFKELYSIYLPNAVYILRSTAVEQPEIIRIAPFTKYQSGVEGKPTVYVCRNHQCELPVTEINEMLRLIAANK